MINACVRCGETQRAKEFLQVMKTVNCNPNEVGTLTVPSYIHRSPTPH